MASFQIGPNIAEEAAGSFGMLSRYNAAKWKNIFG
jgi:hypothetical protein